MLGFNRSLLSKQNAAIIIFPGYRLKSAALEIVPLEESTEAEEVGVVLWTA